MSPIDPKAEFLVPPELRHAFQCVAKTVPQRGDAEHSVFDFHLVKKMPDLEVAFDRIAHTENERLEIIRLLSQKQPDRGALSRRFIFVRFIRVRDKYKGFLARTEDVAESYYRLLSERSLRRSESRLLLHISLGYRLNECSAIVTNSYETNRSLMKEIGQKLETKGQQGLIALGYSILSQDLLPPISSEPVDAFGIMSAFGKNGFARSRIHSHVSRHGSTVAVLEMGPEEGRPVILVPTLRIPYLSGKNETKLFERGVRLFLILRPGSFSEAPTTKMNEYESLVSDSIADLANSFPSNGSLTVVYHGSGAKFFDTQVVDSSSVGRRILFLPVVRESGGSGPFRRLFAWFQERSGSNPESIDRMIRALMKLCANKQTFAKLARGLHAGKDADDLKVRADLECDERLDFFHMAYRASLFSLSADLTVGLVVTQQEIVECLDHCEVWFGVDFLKRLEKSAALFQHADQHSLRVVPDCGEYAGDAAWDYLFSNI